MSERKRTKSQAEEKQEEIQLHETTAHKHVNYNAIDKLRCNKRRRCPHRIT